MSVVVDVLAAVVALAVWLLLTSYWFDVTLERWLKTPWPLWIGFFAGEVLAQGAAVAHPKWSLPVQIALVGNSLALVIFLLAARCRSRRLQYYYQADACLLLICSSIFLSIWG